MNSNINAGVDLNQNSVTVKKPKNYRVTSPKPKVKFGKQLITIESVHSEDEQDGVSYVSKLDDKERKTWSKAHIELLKKTDDIYTSYVSTSNQ